MVTARWKSGIGFLKADAQKCYEEISSIGHDVTAQQVVDKARDESCELHKCFEWDDRKAAESYRLDQARWVLRHLVAPVNDKNGDVEEPVRLFFKTPDSAAYKPTELIVQRKDEYASLLAQALRELSWFRKKYERLVELEAVFEAIDEIVS